MDIQGLNDIAQTAVNHDENVVGIAIISHNPTTGMFYLDVAGRMDSDMLMEVFTHLLSDSSRQVPTTRGILPIIVPKREN